VPEALAHIDDLPAAGENQVWVSGQIRGMEPVTVIKRITDVRSSARSGVQPDVRRQASRHRRPLRGWD
jgi:hypothetical protein